MKTNRKWNRILAGAMALCLAGTTFLVGCGPTTPSDNPNPDDPTPGEKEVTKIEITTMPEKLEFFVGEEFSYEGGELTVTYSDNSTEKVPFTAEGVEISNVNISINGDTDTENKTVTVRYGGERATYQITVAYELFNVTFDYNYDDKTEVVSVRKDFPVEEPETPARTDFEFNGWFADEALTDEYDFSANVTADMTLYASWLSTAANYYTVTFDNNYEFAPNGTTQRVEEGTSATQPSVAPTRKGYKFTGWYTTPGCTESFDFSSSIAANTTVYAGWEFDAASIPDTALSDGRYEYVFEAENTNLDGKSGPGLSGTATGSGMIQTAEGFGASGDQFVGYQYEVGCTLTFTIISDRDVDDATIILRLSAEYRDITIDDSTYQVSLNNESLPYEIAFEDVPAPGGGVVDVDNLYALPFEDYVIAENVQLKEGSNIISLMTNNTDQLAGTTMTSAAPLVDCLKIQTSAVLDWAAKVGLPKIYD